MDLKQFEKELIARKDWSCKRIRVVGWEGKLIKTIAEFQFKEGGQYYGMFIAKGKKISANVKRVFVAENMDKCTNITFEEIKEEGR